MRVFPEMVDWGGIIHPECGQHHCRSWGTKLKKKDWEEHELNEDQYSFLSAQILIKHLNYIYFIHLTYFLLLLRKFSGVSGWSCTPHIADLELLLLLHVPRAWVIDMGHIPGLYSAGDQTQALCALGKHSASWGTSSAQLHSLCGMNISLCTWRLSCLFSRS